jgi:hypothetical protein
MNLKVFHILKEKNKQELLDILLLVCSKNLNAEELLYNILNNKKTSSKKALIKIMKLIDDPTSEYTNVYMTAKHFLETSISEEETMAVALELAIRFMDELEEYDYMYPQELLDMTLEFFAGTLAISLKKNDTSSAEKLYKRIPGDNEYF